MTWAPPESQLPALDHYNDHCCHSVNAVDFKARAQHYNLLIAEKEALTRLAKCGDMVIKSVDTGGAVVVWSHPLYIAEANPQLCDGRFYEHLDHDPIKSVQHQFSPNNIGRSSRVKVMRITKLITKGRML